MEEADRAVLDVLRDEILDPDVIEQAIDLAVTEYAGDPEQIERDRAQVQGELERVAAEITKGLGLVLRGLASEDEIAATLKPARDRKMVLTARLEHLQGLALVPSIDRDALRAHLRDRLADWKGLLLAEPVQARQILRKLIAGRPAFAPTPEGIGFTGEATFGKLLAGLVDCQRPAHSPSDAFPRTSDCAGDAGARTAVLRTLPAGPNDS